MPMLLDRQLLIVTGKGGTGKTTIAAGLAGLAARQGKRVLLCQTDTHGDIGMAFGLTRVGYDPVEVEPRLFAMSMETEKALQEYLHLNLKLPLAMRVGPLAKIFDFVATAAPGVREILTIGKLAWEVKRENYDLVVVDAAATGHIVSQLGSPDSIGELVQVGPLTSQTAWMRDLLRNPERTGAVIVATPEEMPVSESIQLAGQLRDVTQTPLAAVVMNRVLPELFSRSGAQVFDQLQTPQSTSLLHKEVEGDVDAVFSAARLAHRLRRTQVRHIDTLREAMGDDTPFIFVPQSFGPDDAKSVVREAMDALGGELE